MRPAGAGLAGPLPLLPLPGKADLVGRRRPSVYRKTAADRDRREACAVPQPVLMPGCEYLMRSAAVYEAARSFCVSLVALGADAGAGGGLTGWK
jgi:hypothetical protein